MLILLAFLTLAHSRCSLGITFAESRPEANPRFALLRATRDSVSDGTWYPSLGDYKRTVDYPVMARHGAEVFGQVFEMIDTRDSTEIGPPDLVKVVVIWWGVGVSCQRVIPYRAIGVPSGDLFLYHRPRPRSEWIDGMAVYDVWPTDWTYAPALPRNMMINARVPEGGHGMSVQAYAKWFLTLPVRP